MQLLPLGVRLKTNFVARFLFNVTHSFVVGMEDIVIYPHLKVNNLNKQVVKNF